jgi:D-inositol-3-phosphate glycosyltransferase
MNELTLSHPAGHLRQPDGQPFGKDVANVGLFSALARHGGFERINVLRQLSVSAAELAPQFFPADGPRRVLATGSLVNTDLPRRSGLLLRGAAALAELAWVRRTASADADYSLVGLIHTTAPPFIRHQIAASVLAPTHPWDAVICTSPSVQQAMQAMLDQQVAWLQERFGVRHTPQPQLPT